MSEPIRIFIVEDERRIARFLQIELEHEGFSTEIEEDGARAFERLMQESYDLILLDVMLPGMDGITICKRVHDEAVCDAGASRAHPQCDAPPYDDGSSADR